MRRHSGPMRFQIGAVRQLKAELAQVMVSVTEAPHVPLVLSQGAEHRVWVTFQRLESVNPAEQFRQILIPLRRLGAALLLIGFRNRLHALRPSERSVQRYHPYDRSADEIVYRLRFSLA